MRMWFILGHGVSAAVGRGDVDGQGASGLLDHVEHLHLGLQLQAVAALALHQGRTCSQHPHQPAGERGEQLRGPGGSSVLHREVNSSAGSVHIHIGRTCQLWDKHTLKFNFQTKQNRKNIYLHCKLMHPVSSPDWMGVGINQPCNNKVLMTGLM